MTDLERFLAVARADKPDYVPIFGFHGSPGMAAGCMESTRLRLVEQGMPEWVGAGGGVEYIPGWGDRGHEVGSWFRYWGSTGPIMPEFSPAREAKGIGEEHRTEGEFEIIEYETGAVTRQVIDNDNTYSMPEFTVKHVRDRAGWELYRDLVTPPGPRPGDELESLCRELDDRKRPLMVSVPGPYGWLRAMWGEERVCTIPYDDPALVREQVEFRKDMLLRYTRPLIERLKPEIVGMGEDICYNHGLLISPRQFREFFEDYYRAVGTIVQDCGVPVFSVDTDGNLMEYSDVVIPFGVNCLHPLEVKAGNDLFELRRKHPGLIMVGGLEKESVNNGNTDLIAQEINTKVPALLPHGRYFPNGDHGIQPFVTFDSLCRFMTLLHEQCGNPEGEFPRVAT